MIKMKKGFIKKTMSMILIFMMVFELIPIFKGEVYAAENWNNTADTSWYIANNSTFTISTAEELAGLAQLVNSGTDFYGKTVNLAADISLNDTSNWENWATAAPANAWTAIGTSDKNFAGTFDGNNHSVSGIYINQAAADNQGLFGYVFFGEIKNVGVKNSYINAHNYVGGVVGNSYCSISNCYNTGTIYSTNQYTGGVVGWASGGDNSVTNCYNSGIVYGLYTVGGVAGYSNAQVSDCYNKGTITALWQVAGGVVGSNESTTTDCYNLGAVYGVGYNGGVVGQNSQNITNCYNEGTVTVSAGYPNGGISGVCWQNCSISNCYNSGKVSGTTTDSLCISIGGIVGSLMPNSTVDNCYNTGAVAGYQNIGGIIGANYGTLINSYNIGAISGNSYIGGLIGAAYGGTARNCYNASTVVGTHMSQQNFGVVGYAPSGTFTNCYYNNEMVTVSNSKGTGLSSASIKDISNLAGLDPTVWTNAPTQYSTVDGGGVFSSSNPVNLGNPVLKSYGYTGDDTSIDSQLPKDTNGTTLLIKNAYQLDLIREYTGPGNNGKQAKLANNINISPSQYNKSKVTAGSWIPLGNANVFYCSLDGNNKTVSGIFIDQQTLYSQGLIGKAHGVIQNLGVINGYVKGDCYVGGVAGFADGSYPISNCYNTADIVAASCGGGIVGYKTGSLIHDCYNSGKIDCPNNAGGIVGLLIGTVSNCYNKGAIIGVSQTGGIAGASAESSYAMLNNCYNEGIISGGEFTGGIIGASRASVESCYNIANVIVTSDYTGGIAGSNEGYIINSYNTGSLVTGANTGGIAGVNYYTVLNSYYSGCDKGMGNDSEFLTGATQFSAILNNSSIGIGSSTTISTTNPVWDTANALGTNFGVSVANCTSSLATITGNTVTGTSTGSGSITGSMVITQNSLTTQGYMGAISKIIIPVNMPLTVTLATPTITISPIASTIVGNNITLTATLANGNSPTGTVIFKNGTATIGTTNTITGGVATFIYTTTSVGSLSLTAEYSGDVNNNAVVSSSLGTTINKKQPTLSLTASPVSPGSYPNTVTLTATLANVYGPIFNQSINIIIDGIQYPVTTNLGGIASYTFTPTSAKDYSISASFASDANNNMATSSTLTYSVNKGTQTTLAITNAPATTTVGDGKFTLGTTGGSGTGAVTYVSTNTAVLSVNATTGEVTIVAPGTATITATKVADSNYNSTSVTSSVITVSPLVNAQVPTFVLNLTGDTTYYQKDNAEVLTVSATATDGGTVSYQWFKNSTNSTTGGTVVTGETKVTFTPPTDTIGNQFYYVIATSTNNAVNGVKITTQTSAIKKIIVNAKTVEIIETPAVIQNPKLITAVPQENAFTQSVEVKIKDSATVKQAIETALAGLATQSNIDITTIIPLDINVYIKGTETKVQPSEGTSVTITIPIPENLLANKDKVKVVCIIDEKLTFIDTKVVLVEGVYCVQFNATHFSPYGLIVNNEATQTPADAGNSPKTGDNNRTIPLAILASLSLVTIEVILKKRKYKVAKRA